MPSDSEAGRLSPEDLLFLEVGIGIVSGRNGVGGGAVLPNEEDFGDFQCDLSVPPNTRLGKLADACAFEFSNSGFNNCQYHLTCI